VRNYLILIANFITAVMG